MVELALFRYSIRSYRFNSYLPFDCENADNHNKHTKFAYSCLNKVYDICC